MAEKASDLRMRIIFVTIKSVNEWENLLLFYQVHFSVKDNVATNQF